MLEEGDEIGVGGHTFRFTRQPLGPGLKPVALGHGAGEQDDRLSRRETELALGAVTGTGRAVSGGARSLAPIVLAVIVVIALAAYFLTR